MGITVRYPVKFPARVSALDPIIVEKSGGEYIFSASDALTNLSGVTFVQSRSYGTPPITPPDGTVYIVPTVALTGAFVGHPNEKAFYHAATDSWSFKIPDDEMAFVQDEAKFLYFKTATGSWFDIDPGAIVSQIPTLTGTTGGPVDYAANGPVDFTMTVGALFLFIPNVDNETSPTLTVTPSAGAPTGPWPIFDNDDTSILNGMLQAGVPYFLRVRTAFSFQVLTRLQRSRAKEFTVVNTTDGTTPGRITFSGPNLSIDQSVDGTEGTMREVLNISEANGKLRALYGFKVGKTAAISTDVFSLLNPPLTGSLNLKWEDLKTLITASTGPNTNETALPVDVTTTVPRYLTVMNALNGGYRVVGNTAAKFDARLLLSYRPVRIYVEAGSTADINVGSQGSWLGAAAGQIMASFAGGTLFEISRVDDTTWAYQMIIGAAPTMSATPRWTANYTIVISGQSQHKLGVTGGIATGFQRALAEYVNSDDVYIIDASYSGSAMIEGNATISPTWYWFEYAADNPGPLALSWKAAIDQAVLDGQPIPVADFWNQGSTDADSMVTEAVGVSPGATTYSFFVSKFQAMNTYKRAQFPGMKIGLVPLGSDDHFSALVDQRRNAVRLAQLKGIRSDANAFRCMDYYDLWRPDNVYFGIGAYHLTFKAQEEQGYRLGLDYLKNIRGVAIASSGPYIESVTKISTTQYRVAVNTGYASPAISGRDDNPTLSTNGFGLYDSSNPDPMEWIRLPIDQIRWSGSAPYLFDIYSDAAEAVANVTLVYPDGAAADIAATRRFVWQSSPPRLPMMARDIGP